MDIKEAFATLISEYLWYKKLGILKSSAHTLMNRFEQDKLSHEKMKEILLLSGASFTPEIWKLKK